MEGNLSTIGGQWQVHFRRELRHSPERVWQALTEPAQLAAWFPTSIDGDRRPGAALSFSFPNGEATSFAGRMLTVDPPRLLEFEWGPDHLRFVITPTANGCVLELFDTFTERGRAARDAAGWHSCIELLDDHLGSVVAPSSARQRWSEVHADYVRRFGPEAATIGPPSGPGG